MGQFMKLILVGVTLGASVTAGGYMFNAAVSGAYDIGAKVGRARIKVSDKGREIRDKLTGNTKTKSKAKPKGKAKA